MSDPLSSCSLVRRPWCLGFRVPERRKRLRGIGSIIILFESSLEMQPGEFSKATRISEIGSRRLYQEEEESQVKVLRFRHDEMTKHECHHVIRYLHCSSTTSSPSLVLEEPNLYANGSRSTPSRSSCHRTGWSCTRYAEICVVH